MRDIEWPKLFLQQIIPVDAYFNLIARNPTHSDYVDLDHPLHSQGLLVYSVYKIDIIVILHFNGPLFVFYNKGKITTHTIFTLTHRDMNFLSFWYNEHSKLENGHHVHV